MKKNILLGLCVISIMFAITSCKDFWHPEGPDAKIVLTLPSGWSYAGASAHNRTTGEGFIFTLPFSIDGNKNSFTVVVSPGDYVVTVMMGNTYTSDSFSIEKSQTKSVSFNAHTREFTVY
jgi:hypothetical protein